jgi:hypothetical protein
MGQPMSDLDVMSVLVGSPLTGADVFGQEWLDARERVLTRYADTAEQSARSLRERAPAFPADADGMRSAAEALDGYAVACRASAADPSLPTPEYVPGER